MTSGWVQPALYASATRTNCKLDSIRCYSVQPALYASAPEAIKGDVAMAAGVIARDPDMYAEVR